MIKNRICELLGIRYPIIQAPMNWVSGAELVAAVSSAGGMGTLGPNSGAKEITYDVELTAERMRDQIRKVRTLTDAPFAVNVVIGVGETVKYSERIVEVVIEEKVPVVVASVGRPDIYTKRFKEAGINVLHAISTGRHAQKACMPYPRAGMHRKPRLRAWTRSSAKAMKPVATKASPN